MKTIAIAAALLALLPAHAGAEPRRAEVRVFHADLNLLTETGVRTLDRRITAAAEAVCPDIVGVNELARRLNARRCVARTIEEVQPQRDRIVAARAATWSLAQRTR